MRGVPAFMAMLGLCFVVMLTALDQTLIGTALPRIVADLQGFEYYSWVGTAYLLTSAIAVPITGRLGDLFGRKPFVLGAIVLFVAASLGCAMAGSMLHLVAARSLQGVGAGMLIGCTFASVADIFPDQMRRIRWQAMMSSAFGVANATGPTLGGYLTQEFGWRAAFFVNLPVGIVALLVVMRYFPRVAGGRDPDARIDWPGALLLGLTIALALFALQEGAARGLMHARTWVLAAAAIVAGAVFIRSQRRARQPILPLHLFEIRAVRLLAVIGICIGWTLFVMVFYAPLLLQAGFGLSPNAAGLLVTPLVVGITIGSIVNGRLFTRMRNPQRLLPAGILVYALAYVAVMALRPDMAHVWAIVAFSLAGFALGFQMPNLTIQVQACVERRDIGMASALVQTVRVFGSLIGGALAGAVVTASYRSGMADALSKTVAGQRLSPDLAAAFADPQILVAPAARIAAQKLTSPAAFDALLVAARDTLIGGVHGAFLLSLAACLIALVLALRLPPIKPRD